MTDPTLIQWCERVLAEARKAMEAAAQGEWISAATGKLGTPDYVRAKSKDDLGRVKWVMVADCFDTHKEPSGASNARYIVLAAAAFPQWLREREKTLRTLKNLRGNHPETVAARTCAVADFCADLAPVAAALGIEPPGNCLAPIAPAPDAEKGSAE